MLRAHCGYMLDTNVFNTLSKETISLETSCEALLVATHVQADELRNTRNPVLQQQLLRTFEEITPELISTSSAAWDVSDWDGACWSDDDGVFENMLKRVIELDDASKEKKSIQNQQRDALIAETALKRNLVLVSTDSRLRTVMEEFGGAAISLNEFLTGNDTRSVSRKPAT
jgi:predicted nucleic acid-binding protein